MHLGNVLMSEYTHIWTCARVDTTCELIHTYVNHGTRVPAPRDASISRSAQAPLSTAHCNSDGGAGISCLHFLTCLPENTPRAQDW